MYFEFLSPSRIVFGRNAIDTLPSHVTRYGKVVLLVFGRNFARRYGYVDRLHNLLCKEGLRVHIVEGIEPNPSIEQCNYIGEKYYNKGIDVIVAFGGGSVIDAAKAIAVKISLTKDLSKLLYPNTIDQEIVPIIAIPTTCGTGSEVTRYSILTDTKRKRKVALVGSGIIPRVAFIDPGVLVHLPKSLLIWTSLDALSHAIESFIASTSNMFSQMFSIEAIRIIINNITYAISNSVNDIHILQNLHLASTLAGFAINITGTTLTHALGYYLTTHHGLHHGLANAVILLYSIEISLYSLQEEKLRRLLEVFHVNTIEGMLRKLAILLKRLGIPTSLNKIGVSPQEIDDITQITLEYRRNIENTPVEIDKEVIKKILLKAFKGIDQYL